MTLLTKIKYLIPNLLSLFRLILAGLFPFSPENLWFWLIVFGMGSDFLDGLLARRWQTTTWKGSLLDGLADKAFMLAALITLAAAARFPLYLIPLIILRDLTVAVVAAYTAYNRSWESFKKMKAKWTGKLATGGQFLLLILYSLVPEPFPTFLTLVILLSLLAAIDYGRLFIRALAAKRKTAGDNTGL